MMSQRALTLGVWVLLCTSCVTGEPAALGSERQAVNVSNGVSLNGVSLNGVSLNGVSLNGVSLNGVSLNGVSLNGVSLNGVSLNGVSLNGVSLNGSALTATNPPMMGAQWVGSSLVGTLSSGATLAVRIDTVRQGAGSASDIWYYRASYQTDAGWLSLCGVDSAGVPVEAVPVVGVWDAVTARKEYPAGQFSFGCLNGAIGKCVAVGYKPWTMGKLFRTIPTSVDGHHQACVRAIRADYCGDGTSWTRNGVPINIYDTSMNVVADTENWTKEAEWTSKGAYCVYQTRLVQEGPVACVLVPCAQNVNVGGIVTEHMPR